MEVVTLAQAVLNRIGSATHRGAVAHKETSITRQVPDDSQESLMELVKALAEENGESRVQLKDLAPVRNHSSVKGAVVFDIRTPNVQYSDSYAVCVTFQALKVNGRYYKLEEIKV